MAYSNSLQNPPTLSPSTPAPVHNTGYMCTEPSDDASFCINPSLLPKSANQSETHTQNWKSKDQESTSVQHRSQHPAMATGQPSQGLEVTKPRPQLQITVPAVPLKLSSAPTPFDWQALFGPSGEMPSPFPSSTFNGGDVPFGPGEEELTFVPCGPLDCAQEPQTGETQDLSSRHVQHESHDQITLHPATTSDSFAPVQQATLSSVTQLEVGVDSANWSFSRPTSNTGQAKSSPVNQVDAGGDTIDGSLADPIAESKQATWPSTAPLETTEESTNLNVSPPASAPEPTPLANEDSKSDTWFWRCMCSFQSRQGVQYKETFETLYILHPEYRARILKYRSRLTKAGLPLWVHWLREMETSTDLQEWASKQQGTTAIPPSRQPVGQSHSGKQPRQTPSPNDVLMTPLPTKRRRVDRPNGPAPQNPAIEYVRPFIVGTRLARLTQTELKKKHFSTEDLRGALHCLVHQGVQQLLVRFRQGRKAAMPRPPPEVLALLERWRKLFNLQAGDRQYQVMNRTDLLRKIVAGCTDVGGLWVKIGEQK